jgi:H/ACA ribonucleoprotein complex subunit 3
MRVKPTLRKCPVCEKYTMKTNCDQCEEETKIPKPARYSPEDKYGYYRRKLKKSLMLEQSSKETST